MLTEANINEQELMIVPQGGMINRLLYFFCKRCMDVVLATLLLILLSPLLLLIAILIKLDTPGPVIFVQERVGSRRCSRAGKMTWKIQNFPFYKFRSMVHNVDQSAHQAYVEAWVQGHVLPSGVGGASFKLTNDRRVTRVGRVLRRTSLDELPQLVNVLKGEMSLVGPRPVPTYEVAQYQPWQYERLAVLPGITGLWQVQGRGRVSFDEMMRMDIEYVRNQSLWLDVKLLLLTIPAVLSGQGAQ
jgi:lipopolysaccharide/colanic/teichoic acid biosynthesis glycosyltransferase